MIKKRRFCFCIHRLEPSPAIAPTQKKRLNPTTNQPWWRHQMETFSALLAICAGTSSVPGEFPAQRPVTRSFDVFFYLRLNKRLSKQSRGWWFETLPRPLWRHSNADQSPSKTVTVRYARGRENRFIENNFISVLMVLVAFFGVGSGDSTSWP